MLAELREGVLVPGGSAQHFVRNLADIISISPSQTGTASTHRTAFLGSALTENATGFQRAASAGQLQKVVFLLEAVETRGLAIRLREECVPIVEFRIGKSSADGDQDRHDGTIDRGRQDEERGLKVTARGKGPTRSAAWAAARRL